MTNDQRAPRGARARARTGTALAIAALLCAAATALAQEPMKLTRGEVTVMEIGSIERVAVGDGSLLGTSILTNGQLVILAEKVGKTNIHIWFSDGRERDFKVEIYDQIPPSAASNVGKLLENIKGISVREIDGRAVIEGQVDAADKPILDTILASYPDVLNLTREPTASFGDKMIYMNLRITEISGNAVENIGIDWATDIAGPSAGLAAEINEGKEISVLNDSSLAPLLATDATAAFGFFGIATSIASRINFLASSGNALILAEPRLSARSGGEAEFLAGGEIPIPVSNSLGGTNVEFKEFGIRLRIKPIADEFGNITAEVEAEVSAVDQSNAVNGIPGFLSRKTSTEVTMRDGETLVISGLMNQDTAEDVSGIKGLRDLPIIGAFFRNKNFRSAKRELVIFVTPQIFDSSGEENRRRVERERELREKFYNSIRSKQILD